MSDIYYLGTFEGNEINKPIVLPGSKKRALDSLLQLNNIDMYKDFHYCCTDDRHVPLFYQVTDEYSYLRKNEEYKDIWQEGINLENIKEFPVVCDGIERDNVSYHIILEKVFEPNYKLNDRIVSLETAKEIVKDQNEWFVFSVMEDYKTVIHWIKRNKKIYFYKYA